jgi:hypothetical protein
MMTTRCCLCLDATAVGDSVAPFAALPLFVRSERMRLGRGRRSQ